MFSNPLSLSIHHGDGLNLDHHFGPRQFLNTDQRASWIAALLKKLFAEMCETGAVGHVGNEDSHGDNVIQLAAGFFQRLPDALEAQPHLPVEIAGVTLASLILERSVTSQVNRRAAANFNGGGRGGVHARGSPP